MTGHDFRKGNESTGYKRNPFPVRRNVSENVKLVVGGQNLRYVPCMPTGSLNR
jgi:hypothetical protein